MIRAVLDTNVLASGLISAGTAPGHLLSLWEANAFELTVSHHIMVELERTLAKPYFESRFHAGERERAIERLRAYARSTAITVVVEGVATHPEDDLVLATAISAGATVLVTGDRGLREVGAYRGVTILTPREFSTLLEQVGLNQS